MRIGVFGRPAQRYADQSAHRRAEPVDRFDIQARDQRDHVGDILRHAVVARIGEPVRQAAPDHVRADHAIVGGERAGKRIEIAARARQAMHAQQHTRIGGITPLGV